MYPHQQNNFNYMRGGGHPHPHPHPLHPPQPPHHNQPHFHGRNTPFSQHYQPNPAPMEMRNGPYQQPMYHPMHPPMQGPPPPLYHPMGHNGPIHPPHPQPPLPGFGFNQMQNMNGNMNSQPPPASYVCRKCNVPGHWIQDCRGRSQNNLPPPTSQMQNSYRPQQETKKKKKSIDLGEFTCKPCEKLFTQKSQYDAHLESHVPCWADNCDFEGAKKVVTKHYQTTHGQYAGSGMKEIEVEGQKFTVLVGNSAKDIAKWRDERRKRWPSTAVVKQKEEDLKKRHTAGDIVSFKRQKTMVESNGQSTAEPMENNTVQTRLSNDTSNTEEPVSENAVENSNEDAPVSTTAVEPTPPSETATPTKSNNITTTTTTTNSKKNYCTHYIRNSCRKGDKCIYNHDLSDIPCKAFTQNGKCKRGDACKFLHDEELHKNYQNQKSIQKQQANVMSQVNDHKRSLLRKLLQKDISKENRHILQVFRYIIQNNFFIPSKSDSVNNSSIENEVTNESDIMDVEMEPTNED